MTKVKFFQFIVFYSYALISEKNVNELCAVSSFSIESDKKESNNLHKLYTSVPVAE